jgi:aminopeptidase N
VSAKPPAALLTILLTTAAAAQLPTEDSGGPLRAVQAAFDVRHVDLAVTVDPKRRRIDGKMTMKARLVGPTPRIELDLDSRLQVTAVTVGGEQQPVQHAEGRIEIQLGEGRRVGDELEVAVEYGGTPREAPNPPWEGGFTWATTRGGAPWIATSCQGEGADLWWPCKDHPSDKAETIDLHVTVPAELVCAANGTLVDVDGPKGGVRTFHWHVANPISNYCIALNIGPYAVIERTYESTSGDQVPVSFWVLPEHRERGEKALPDFLDHLRHLE